MAGLYLHIPFCRQACHYCNFHFATSLARKEELLRAMQREIVLQKDYLGQQTLQTLYLGGGTPSLLSAAELNALFEVIYAHFSVADQAEITLEANPDDLTPDYLEALRSDTPVNRLSIGIQSFHERDLRFMNRAHNAAQAAQCIALAREAGFDNLSLDLIYGIPGCSDEEWLHNINTAIASGANHLSCYALTVEPRTPLEALIRKGIAPATDDDAAAQQYELLFSAAEAAGFEAYEISNFARPGHRSRHNSSYWEGTPYLGIGPSAHSYDGNSRQWNEANNARYTRLLLEEDTIPFERELLTPRERFNEYIMTRLRTSDGLDPQQIQQRFGAARLADCQQRIAPFMQSGHVATSPQHHWILTRSGRFLADGIAATLFAEPDEPDSR